MFSLETLKRRNVSTLLRHPTCKTELHSTFLSDNPSSKFGRHLMSSNATLMAQNCFPSVLSSLRVNIFDCLSSGCFQFSSWTSDILSRLKNALRSVCFSSRWCLIFLFNKSYIHFIFFPQFSHVNGIESNSI